MAIAPRGYPQSPLPVQRLTVAYGGAADTVKLIRTVAELATQWRVQMRIASFTVRPALMFGGSIERSAEDLVTQQWTRKTTQAVRRQLDEARASIALPDVDVVIGAGTDWPTAVNAIAWKSGDLLVLGSGAAGPRTQVFLGSAASNSATRARPRHDRATPADLDRPADPAPTRLSHSRSHVFPRQAPKRRRLPISEVDRRDRCTYVFGARAR